MEHRILIISTIPFYGGGEKFISTILSQINGKLIFLISNEQLYEELKSEEVYLFRNNYKNYFRQLQEVKSIIKSQKIDCIILNGVSAIFFAPFIKCDKVIAYNHMTNDGFNNMFNRLLYSLAINFSYLFTNAIIHPSRYALKQQFLNKKKAVCIYNGVKIPNTKCTKRINTPLNVLFLGRIEPIKGIDIVLNAFQKIPPDIATLNIVGDGSYVKYIKDYTTNNINYTGFSTEVEKYYNNADVFVTLPTNESFGLTIVEAMSYGLAVITCSTGGIPEIIKNDFNGIIIERDVNSLVSAIIKLSNNNSIVAQLSKNAYEHALENFDYHKTIHILNKLIQS